MDQYYLYHHLGLGDSFICNGLVRFFCNKYGNIKLFCKSHYYETLKFMYRDNPNIGLIIGVDYQVSQYLNSLNGPNKSILIMVGFHNLWVNYNNPSAPNYSPSLSFDMRFYEIMGLDFKIRFDDFFVERDINIEKEFFNKFNVKEGEYIFVHDDDRFRINLDKIDTKGLTIVKPFINLTPNIFDYCYLIENAKEVHTIESSFQFMIDSLKLNTENYTHRYPRHLTEGEKPIYQTVKQIIT